MDLFEHFHSLGIIDDIDVARKTHLRNLLLDTYLYIDEYDPDMKLFELRLGFLQLIERHFCDGKHLDMSSFFPKSDIIHTRR